MRNGAILVQFFLHGLRTSTVPLTIGEPAGRICGSGCAFGARPLLAKSALSKMISPQSDRYGHARRFFFSVGGAERS